MIKIKNKGFTLIELLVVIALISLVFGAGGSFFYNIITKADDKTELLVMDSIKKSVNVYIDEYPNDVVWIKNTDNTSYTCISIDVLINKGYLKKENIDSKNISKYKFISITKDENQNLIDWHFSEVESCGTENKRKVIIPTAKEYCSYPIYTGTSQSLIKKDTVGFEFKKNNGINAGNYTIEAILQEGYIWIDNSKENKKITCFIKKASPMLYFEKDSHSNNGYLNGEDGTNLGDSIIYLKSDVAGIVTLKSSNLKVADAIIENDRIIKNVRNKIIIQKKTTNKSNIYITFKFEPDDKQNYNSGEIIYTIGDTKKIPVKKPVCRNLYYNGISQDLVSKNNGYFLLNNTQTNLGKYKVIAELNYGYIWEDGSEGSYSLNCEIQAPTLNVTYDTDGGSGCTKETVKYGDSYGNLCNPVKTGYTFNGWYTKLINGNKIESTTKVDNYLDHTLYAHWTKNIYTITYNSNGGSNCSPISKSLNYLDEYGSLCKPSKHDYTFEGWYTELSGGNKVDENTKIGARNITIYAHWIGVKKTNIAVFNYKIDKEHNFEKIGNQVNSSSPPLKCTYQVPKTSCVIKTPGIKIYDSTTTGKTKTLFKFQWKNNSNNRDIVELDTDITLSKEKSEYTLLVTANSNYYNEKGKIKGGKDNAWIRTSDTLTNAMNNNQLIGIVTRNYDFYWKDGDYQIGTTNHLIWLKGYGYGARCDVIGNATKDSCNKNQCNSTNCRVPASGEGWSSLRALKW